MGYKYLLRNYFFIQRKYIFILFMLVFISVSLQLIVPQLLKYFIDSISNSTISSLIKTAFFYILLSVILQIFLLSSAYIGEKVAWNATNKLRVDLTDHCLNLNLYFHNKFKSTKLVENIDGDTSQLSNFFSVFLVSSISNIFVILGILFLLFREGWQIGVSLSIFVLISFLVIGKIRKFAVRFWVSVRDIRTEYFSKSVEFINGIEILQAFKSKKIINRKLEKIFTKWLHIRMKAQLASITLFMSIVFIFALGNAIALAICAYLYPRGVISLGSIYMIFFYTELLRQPIEQLRLQIDNLQIADASIERINKLLKKESIFEEKSVEDSQYQINKYNDTGLVYENIYFKYENEDILTNINLEVKKGEKLILVGKTGSGKTTLTKLLLRFYVPYSGNISIDGININNIPIKELRNKIQWISQDIELFNTTIRNNITLYNPNVKDEQILEIINNLGLTQYYESIEEGLNKMVEENGKNISAGEAQILMWCRLLIRDSEIVILDEASSKIDLLTESSIMNYIENYLKDKITIIITHKKEYINNNQNIKILEDGKMVNN